MFSKNNNAHEHSEATVRPYNHRPAALFGLVMLAIPFLSGASEGIATPLGALMTAGALYQAAAIAGEGLSKIWTGYKAEKNLNVAIEKLTRDVERTISNSSFQGDLQHTSSFVEIANLACETFQPKSDAKRTAITEKMVNLGERIQNSLEASQASPDAVNVIKVTMDQMRFSLDSFNNANGKMNKPSVDAEIPIGPSMFMG